MIAPPHHERSLRYLLLLLVGLARANGERRNIDALVSEIVQRFGGPSA